MPSIETAPLMDNEHVKALLAIMEANRLSNTKDFLAVINQVDAMERQLASAVTELSAMRHELAAAKAEAHPAKSTLQNIIIEKQGQLLDLREKLTEVKQHIIDGCKNAVAAFKEKGLSALRNIAEFFNIRPGLESLRDGLEKGIRQDDAAIAKINAISAEYHEAGRHLKNMGRTFIGKETVQKSAPPGKLAAAIAVPYRAERSNRVASLRNINKAIAAIERLENTERKPPIMENIKKLNLKIKETENKSPVIVRPRAVNRDGR